MNRRWALAVVVVGAMTLLLAFIFSHEQRVSHHVRSWQRALRLGAGAQLPWWDRMYGALMRRGSQYWWEVLDRHEAELLKMGYLTNCQFRLTNQVMTREFSSNFFYLISQRLGTNDDQVWRSPYLTNDSGIEPTLPVKDYAVWEQTFRECAARYASNLPPASVTTGPVEGAR